MNQDLVTYRPLGRFGLPLAAYSAPRRAIECGYRLRYQYPWSPHVWEHVFVPADGNNVWERRTNLVMARTHAEAFAAPFRALGAQVTIEPIGAV